MKTAHRLERRAVDAWPMCSQEALPRRSRKNEFSATDLTPVFSNFRLNIRHICRIPAQIRSLYLSPSKPDRCIVGAVNAISVSFLPVSLRWLFPLEVFDLQTLKGLRLCREPFFFGVMTCHRAQLLKFSRIVPYRQYSSPYAAIKSIIFIDYLRAPRL